MSIRELLQPQFEEFQNVCVQLKSDEIIRCIDELKANGMNLCAFNDALPKQRFIQTFATRGIFSMSGCMVEVDDESVKKVLKSEQWRVSKDCEEYAKKLEQKINQELMGDGVVSMTLDGNLWTHSCITVTGESGRIVILSVFTRFDGLIFTFGDGCGNGNAGDI